MVNGERWVESLSIAMMLIQKSSFDDEMDDFAKFENVYDDYDIGSEKKSVKDISIVTQNKVVFQLESHFRIYCTCYLHLTSVLTLSMTCLE